MQIDGIITLARALERWGSLRRWAGTDPYDALNARYLRHALSHSPIALRILTQGVKRSPLNVRPLLAIPSGLSAATLANVISAYARNGFLDEGEARTKLGNAIIELEALRCSGYGEPCWGYHFDVQTRVFFYPRTDPNTIATAFAGLGLLDAYEHCGETHALDLAVGAGEFFLRHVPQTKAPVGAYFGYLAGDQTPIHNANMLVCALLARLARLVGRDDMRAAASAGLEYTLAHQRPDGSWPYGELSHLGWVDGFHTGYVLDAVLTCAETGIGGVVAEEAWRRGLHFYVDVLIEQDGKPRYTPQSRYPIDGQCAAQVIQSLARATKLEPDLAARRFRGLDYAVRYLKRSDGSFMFQRMRLWNNRTPHPRWVQAPMLVALTHLISSV